MRGEMSTTGKIDTGTIAISQKELDRIQERYPAVLATMSAHDLIYTLEERTTLHTHWPSTETVLRLDMVRTEMLRRMGG